MNPEECYECGSRQIVEGSSSLICSHCGKGPFCYDCFEFHSERCERKKCLKCEEWFISTGNSHRLCAKCRRDNESLTFTAEATYPLMRSVTK